MDFLVAGRFVLELAVFDRFSTFKLAHRDICIKDKWSETTRITLSVLKAGNLSSVIHASFGVSPKINLEGWKPGVIVKAVNRKATVHQN